MKWQYSFAFVALIAALVYTIWLLWQPQRFAFRVIEPGTVGSKCIVRRPYPGARMQWICTSADYKSPTMVIEEIQWPKS